MKYSDFLIDVKFLGGGDGSSYENAIIIKADTTMDGLIIEYNCMDRRYGTKNDDWKRDMQSVAHRDNKRYDILYITLKNGEKKTVYFDITQFFEK